MSKLRQINLYRPLLDASKRKTQLKRLALSVAGLFIAANAAVYFGGQMEARSFTQKLATAQGLLKQEEEQQKAFKIAAAVKASDSQVAEIKSLQEQVSAKSMFLAHPEIFAPSQIPQWEQMLSALELARDQEPNAWIDYFEARGVSGGGDSYIAMQGYALSKDAALKFMQAASNSSALAEKRIGPAMIAPYEGPQGNAWAFSLKAGSAK